MDKTTIDSTTAIRGPMVDIGGGLKVYSDTKCESCGAGTSDLRYYSGLLGFEAIECKKCGHQEDLNAAIEEVPHGPHPTTPLAA